MPEFGVHTEAREAAEAYSAYIKGRTILVTGVSPGGIGFETARVIALHHPKLLILAGRSSSKLDAAREGIKKDAPDTPTRSLLMDLSSFASVRKAAEEVNSWSDVPTIDVLIANAAVMACPYQLTEDGIEMQFQSNHLGHFLFTQSVIAKIIGAGSGARIVNVSSRGHRFSDIRPDDWNFSNGKAYEPFLGYGQSKTSNMLYAISLAEKLKSKGVQAFSLHPGTIMTNLGRHIPQEEAVAMGLVNPDGTPGSSLTWKSIPQGASTTIVAAFDPSIAGESGAYLSDCVVSEPLHPYAKDPENAEKLWKLSEKLIGQTFEL